MAPLDPLAYLKILNHDPRPKLFGYAAPGPVRALALKSLEGRKDTDYLLRHAIKDCPRYEPRKQLLESWKEVGHWGIDRLFMRKNGEAAAADRALVVAVRNLYQLNMYLWFGEEGEEHHLDALAELILARTRPDGSLHFISAGSDWTKGLDSSVYASDHWGGYAASILTLYGYEDDRLEKYIAYLKGSQREDGGWLPDYFSTEVEAPSHPLHTTANAFALSADDPKSPQCLRAIEYLLNNWATDRLSYKRASQSEWFKLEAPGFSFSALNILSLAGEAGISFEDPRVERILKWLIEDQEKDGTWGISVNRPTRADETLFLSLRIALVIKEFYSPTAETNE